VDLIEHVRIDTSRVNERLLFSNRPDRSSDSSGFKKCRLLIFNFDFQFGELIDRPGDPSKENRAFRGEVSGYLSRLSRKAADAVISSLIVSLNR